MILTPVTRARHTKELVLGAIGGTEPVSGESRTSQLNPAYFFHNFFLYFLPRAKQRLKRLRPRADLEWFILEHGQPPSQYSELASSRSLYKKKQKLKLTHLLQHDWRKDLCQPVPQFYVLNDERPQEDLLAQRWDRLLEQKAAGLPGDSLQTYGDLIAAVDVEDEGGAVATCVAVQASRRSRAMCLAAWAPTQAFQAISLMCFCEVGYRNDKIIRVQSKGLKMRRRDVGTAWLGNVPSHLPIYWVGFKLCLLLHRLKMKICRHRCMSQWQSFWKTLCFCIRSKISCAKWWPLAYQTNRFLRTVFARFFITTGVFCVLQGTLLAWFWRCLNPCFTFCKGS